MKFWKSLTNFGSLDRSNNNSSNNHLSGNGKSSGGVGAVTSSGRISTTPALQRRSYGFHRATRDRSSKRVSGRNGEGGDPIYEDFALSPSVSPSPSLSSPDRYGSQKSPLLFSFFLTGSIFFVPDSARPSWSWSRDMAPASGSQWAVVWWTTGWSPGYRNSAPEAGLREVTSSALGMSSWASTGFPRPRWPSSTSTRPSTNQIESSLKSDIPSHR